MHPTYRGVAEMIRGWITSGHYPPGSRLPTHQEIADRLHTTRQTVVAAIRTLSHEGLVQTGGSRGTWVLERLVFWTDATRHDDHTHACPDGIDTFNAAVIADGRTPSTRFEMHIGPAPTYVASRLGCAVSDFVCVRSVLQLVDSHPWSRATSYYPLELARECGLDVAHDIPEGEVRRMASHGLVEAGSLDEISARAPSPDETRDLEISGGTAIVLEWCRTAATRDRITRVTVQTMPGDRNAVQFHQGAPDAINVITTARSMGT